MTTQKEKQLEDEINNKAIQITYPFAYKKGYVKGRQEARKELIEEVEKMIDEIKTIYIDDKGYDIELGYYIIKEEDIKQQLQKFKEKK